MIIFYMITAAIAITFLARRTHPAVELIKTLDKTLHKIIAFYKEILYNIYRRERLLLVCMKYYL